MKLSLYEPDRWPELMTPAQVAQLLNITHGTVSRWCDEGTIDATKIGRVWRVPQHAVWPLVPSSLRERWPAGPWSQQPPDEPPPA